MARKLICSLLLAAFLGQGWFQAGMAVPAKSASPADCAGTMSADCDCCPDGAAAGSACASLCSVAFAPALALPEVTVNLVQFRSTFSQPARAGPRYLPLNPPPIA